VQQLGQVADVVRFQLRSFAKPPPHVLGDAKEQIAFGHCDGRLQSLRLPSVFRPPRLRLGEQRACPSEVPFCVGDHRKRPEGVSDAARVPERSTENECLFGAAAGGFEVALVELHVREIAEHGGRPSREPPAVDLHVGVRP
jgi:hypothetical protein